MSVIGLTSCTNTDDAIEPNVEEQVIGIKLPDNTISSREVEDQETTGGKTQLNDVTVFLMVGPSVNKVVSFSQDEIKAQFKKIENVPGMVNKVIVVGNKQGKEIEKLTTESQIKSYAFSVESQHKDIVADTLYQGINSKTHIGESTFTTVSNPTEVGYNKLANVTLNAITSRIEVGDVKPGTGVKSVEMVAVFINNYYDDYSKSVTVFNKEDNNVWITDPIAGLPSSNAFTNVNIINNYTSEYYTDLRNSEVNTTNNDSKCYAYHIFSGNLPHVILLVKGEYEDGYYEDGKKYFLGWLTFSKYNKGGGNYVTVMEPNKIYKMGVGSTGIIVDAKDITDKPEKEGYTLQVEVKVAAWTEEVVTPEV